MKQLLPEGQAMLFRFQLLTPPFLTHVFPVSCFMGTQARMHTRRGARVTAKPGVTPATPLECKDLNHCSDPRGREPEWRRDA